jgi:hypothetical protein
MPLSEKSATCELIHVLRLSIIVEALWLQACKQAVLAGSEKRPGGCKVGI